MAFQSTLPVWGATEKLAKCSSESEHFNPRSPCGERRETFDSRLSQMAFQSTLPVWGATITRDQAAEEKGFQSTLPVWGATGRCSIAGIHPTFQSTLPVWGATDALLAVLIFSGNFNPRSPCGERPTPAVADTGGGRHFNPRSPCGERR